MLKFKQKKRNNFPKVSLILWMMSLIIMLVIEVFPSHKESIYNFAIRPEQLFQLIAQSKIYLFELFSSLMIHASWNHWIGNMITFAIIAPALERKVGAFWFLILFFLSGFFGNLYSVIQFQDSNHYLLGASGAISGLLGAWLMLYPKHKIDVVIPIGLYIERAKIPVIIMIAIWLLIQFIFQYMGSFDQPIVWLAHVVGFFTGFLLSLMYRIIH